ncbi:fructosamine kinase family protein [Intrasporangium sp.]|jgi:fructosamine-3-kinase|uniref:fructosamine kinase family protein n=1 Tax=Intrasporangium sp. TaxID=1925024 RepID=UPI003365B234
MSTRPDGAVHRKSRADAPEGYFQAEAAGLRWLAEAEADGGARVVQVLDVGAHHIDLRRLSPAQATRKAAADLGRALAITHSAGATAFGAPPSGWQGDAWIGSQPQTNDPERSWGRYFAEQRVRPFVRKAVDVGHLADSDAHVVDAVCDRISAGAYDDDSPPARIHGDLWAGNVVFTSAGAVLIDPAAHGGHGLTDLAMLDLFGCPYLEQVLTAYADATALPPRWRRLIPLHQLHPLATHTASHGPGYAAGLVAAARAMA